MWEKMQEQHLPPVSILGNSIHVDFYEDPQVFSERYQLYPAGCFVLMDGDACQGYCVSHPWIKGSPPPLDTLLGGLPNPADTYYIHDLALSERARSNQAASKIVETIKQQAKAEGYADITLVAVNRSTGFWQKSGFEFFQPLDVNLSLESYGDDARYMICPL